MLLPMPSLRLRAVLMICLLAGGPVYADAAPQVAAKLEIGRTAPADPNDPLQQWFHEQDKLLDDILMRLTRIETLVEEIHRLVLAMPDAMQSAPPPKPRAAPPTAIPPAMPATPASTSAGLLAGWLPQLAGAAVLAGVLLWWARRRRSSAAVVVRKTSAMSQPSRAAVPPPVPSSAPAHASRAGESSDSVDQALELAEIMLSMGLGHGAAQTLAEQIRSEPKQALRHWLKLLEIYRSNGQQEEFERSAEELRQHFNVQPEDWQPRPESQRSIANYPHISARLTQLWGKPGCLAFLENLLDDNRGGARSGFPQSVAEELLLLVAMVKSGGNTG
ncbi:MAG: hypothetical protein AB1642_09565 [Pseudomonadota bacterium]